MTDLGVDPRVNRAIEEFRQGVHEQWLRSHQKITLAEIPEPAIISEQFQKYWSARSSCGHWHGSDPGAYCSDLRDLMIPLNLRVVGVELVGRPGESFEPRYSDRTVVERVGPKEFWCDGSTYMFEVISWDSFLKRSGHRPVHYKITVPVHGEVVFEAIGGCYQENNW